MGAITCLNCGMHVSEQIRRCPKCDNHLDQQTDGSTVTIDIAHHGEKVRDALRKLEAHIKETKCGVAQYLKIIVGTGAIRDAALARIMDYERRRVIITHRLEGDNAGAILVTLK
ncbi:MAG: hypothetical protein O6945_03905 [Gammaproteobacteria bacterium]|nr:hypothetical protein [Gammaproteobacteria bacterium]